MLDRDPHQGARRRRGRYGDELDPTILVSVTILNHARSFFSRRQVSIAEVRSGLWTKVDESRYLGAGEKYQSAILEQYKIYVEMADRISARRSLSNTLFLTVNTATLAAAGIFAGNLTERRATLILPLVMLIVQCGAWFWILKSYRQISSAKYRVIGALEERLPASPYWLAEWRAVGAGKDKALYWPISGLEQWVPLAFSVAYLIILAVVVT